MAGSEWEADIDMSFVFQVVLGREPTVCFWIDERAKRTVRTRQHDGRRQLAVFA